MKLLHMRVDKTMTGLASLASALSVFAGFVATRATPHGWHKAIVTLHLSKAPLIVKLAPIVAGIALAFATACALLRFAHWCAELAGTASDTVKETRE